MKKELLEKIGTLFTTKWAKEQDSSKLEGFTESAERCLIGQQDYIKGKIFFWTFLVSAISLWFFESLLSGAIVLAIAIGIKLFAEKVLYEGLTSQKVAQAWRPIRKKLLKHKVLKQSVKIFKRDYSKTHNFVPEDLVRPLLVRALDEVMENLFFELRRLEQYGFPKGEAKILSEMEAVKTLTQDLGLQRSFEDPTKEKVVRGL